METPDRHIATPTAGDSANSIGVSRGRRRNHDAQFACCFCSEIFSLEISRKCHEVEHVSNGHTPKSGFELGSKCKLCNKLFIFTFDIKNHKCAVKERQKPFECNVCHKRYTTKRFWNEHQEIHRRKNKWCCCQCPEIFDCEDDISSHERIHQWLESLELYQPLDCSDSVLIFKSNETESEGANQSNGSSDTNVLDVSIDSVATSSTYQVMSLRNCLDELENEIMNRSSEKSDVTNDDVNVSALVDEPNEMIQIDDIASEEETNSIDQSQCKRIETETSLIDQSQCEPIEVDVNNLNQTQIVTPKPIEVLSNHQVIQCDEVILNTGRCDFLCHSYSEKSQNEHTNKKISLKKHEQRSRLSVSLTARLKRAVERALNRKQSLMRPRRIKFNDSTTLIEANGANHVDEPPLQCNNISGNEPDLQGQGEVGDGHLTNNEVESNSALDTLLPLISKDNNIQLTNNAESNETEFTAAEEDTSVANPVGQNESTVINSSSHNLSLWNMQPNFDCINCKQRFSSKDSLELHRKTHSPQVILKSPEAAENNQTISDPIDVAPSSSGDKSQNHQTVQSIEDSSIKCKHCDKTFHENAKKLEHECLVHGSIVRISRIDDAKMNATNSPKQCIKTPTQIECSEIGICSTPKRKVSFRRKRLTCHFCDKIFYREDNRSIHERSLHQTPEANPGQTKSIDPRQVVGESGKISANKKSSHHQTTVANETSLIKSMWSSSFNQMDRRLNRQGPLIPDHIKHTNSSPQIQLEENTQNDSDWILVVTDEPDSRRDEVAISTNSQSTNDQEKALQNQRIEHELSIHIQTEGSCDATETVAPKNKHALKIPKITLVKLANTNKWSVKSDA